MRLVFGVLLLLVSYSEFSAAQSTDWKITQPTWTERNEKEFGEFVARIGAAVEQRKCKTVDSCLRSTANPYINSDPAGLKYYADCADLPYYLRGYFSWKNGLPFSMISKVAPDTSEGPVERDVRYSPRGNIVLERFDVVAKKSFFGKATFPDALKVLNRNIPGNTFSANYRILGNKDNSDLFTDFYPVQINREGIRPGTIIYDPAGHVAIVYKVGEDGRVFYIDAHPDNTLTMGMYTPKFVRSNPTHGAGFKRFRPLRLVNADRNADGVFEGGRIIGAFNSEISDYGLEQFFGSIPDSSGNWKKGRFEINGNKVDYYDYVRLSLTLGEQHINPLEDMGQLIDDICVSLQDRVGAVDEAIKKGISLKPHPTRLPENIYGTDGEWESYSTPSRDARLKVSYMDLLAQTQKYMQMWRNHDRTLTYSGGNLARDLYQVYAQKAGACQISYRTSNGQKVFLHLESARQRLFDMSFDPYHCIELRWGARSAEELASCQDDANKRQWYAQEKWLRNQWERRYDARMDYSLEELKGPMPGVGITNAPDVDVVRYLKSQM